LTQTQSRMWLTAPGLLFPGDSIVFYIPVKNCCRTTIANCGDVNYNEYVVYQPFYTEPCGLYTYTTGQNYLSYEYMREGLIVNAPANLTNGQTATVTLFK
jgi:hypothetical protein